MLQNLFTSSPLVWGGLIAGLVALPVLIHLINMLRHKRVKWAAMDFLLQSYKRQRNWIWLKQLLLLLARIAVLLLGLFTLANVGCNNDAASKLFGGKTTHHYLLLDDSFSMSDRVGGVTVFDRARKSIQTIASSASNQQNQRLTLLRFSQASVAKTAGAANQTDLDLEERISAIADINGAQIDSKFKESLEERRNQLEVSQLASNPLAALATVQQLIESRANEQAQIHILSDFRAKDWEQSTDLNKRIEQAGQVAKVKFVRCAKKDRVNLAIIDLKPIKNIRAAGVPLFCEVKVKNYSDTVATKISVSLSSSFYDRDQQDIDQLELIESETSELPTVFFEEIGAGETIAQRFAIYFPKPGSHVITASLPEDAVVADNNRQVVVRFEESTKALVIDDENRRHAYYVTNAMQPPNGNTGVSCDIETLKFLRESSVQELQKYAAIYLLDVARFDDDIKRKVVDYVSAGGGLCFFAGTKTDVEHYNQQLFADGKGVFPVPLERTHTLPERVDPRIPDIIAQPHPVFDSMVQSEAGLLDMVQLESILRTPPEWKAVDHDEIRVAAWVRSREGYPLVVEKSVGKGRVVAFLTTAGPQWNNWSKNPTFVVTLLELQDYLSGRSSKRSSLTVGMPIRKTVPANYYRDEAAGVVPGLDGTLRDVVDLKAKLQLRDNEDIESDAETISSNNDERYLFELGGNEDGSGTAQRTGVYEIWTVNQSGIAELNRYTANVDPLEGDLRTVGFSSLTKSFAELAEVINWDDLKPDPHHSAATQLSKILFFILLSLLLLEQLLAYSLSFHPKKAERRDSQNLGSQKLGRRGASL